MQDSEDPGKFYPRNPLDQTASFNELHDHRYDPSSLLSWCWWVRFIVIFLRSDYFQFLNTLPYRRKLLASSCSKNVLRSKYHDYFFHRQEQLWRDNALMTLPALLNSSDMLCCGEDLGMVPACVQPVSTWIIFWLFNFWGCIFCELWPLHRIARPKYCFLHNSARNLLLMCKFLGVGLERAWTTWFKNPAHA